jgi:hypothetical protein
MWAHDSLIGFIDHRFPDYFMHVFNIHTGKFLYPLCRHGEGTDAFIEITFTDQLVIADGQLHFWIRNDYGREECVLMNLEKPGSEVKQKMDLKVDDWKFQNKENNILLTAFSDGQRTHLISKIDSCLYKIDDKCFYFGSKYKASFNGGIDS